MMNTRILDLLKNPKNIQAEDLQILKKEIDSFPYIQNIRALHLYGVHLHDPKNYQKELTTTAAYTTDKKILYQLINGKINNYTPKLQENTPVSVPVDTNTNGEKEVSIKNELEENSVEEINKEKHDYAALSELIVNQNSEIKSVFVNGEHNRILFEGEEMFFDEETHDIIDMESTLESGVIITQKVSFSTENTQIQDVVLGSEIEDKSENEEDLKLIEEILNSKDEINTQSSNSEDSISSLEFLENNTSEIEIIEDSVVQQEIIIDEDYIDSPIVSEKILDESELSFHSTESFLPEVKIESSRHEQISLNESPKSNPYKHEDEIRRLIEEVEKKMKAQKKNETNKDVEFEIENSNEISFAETQEFHIAEEQKVAEEAVIHLAEEIVEEQLLEATINEENVTESIVESEKEQVSTWKPMIFQTHVPDSYSKIVEFQNESDYKEQTPENTEITKETSSEKEGESSTGVISSEDINENTDTEEHIEESEVPVMNVSFFGNDISSLPVERIIPKEESEIHAIDKEIVIESKKVLDSNVPGFINTWQSWLKIDRTEEVVKAKAEIKNKAIESFIENNPKISQLKDEVNFVVKEKTDDISHLMTETLANLYVEQKLYTKAMNAFKVLIKKHPDRKDYFENKIQEIKENRNKN